MSDDLYDLNGLAASLQAALDAELAEGGIAEAAAPVVELTLPARPEHGDLTTNAAMVSAKRWPSSCARGEGGRFRHA